MVHHGRRRTRQPDTPKCLTVREAERSVCVISEMDDGLHRDKQLWTSQAVAVVLPEATLRELRVAKPQCTDTVLFALREAMINSFAASRCFALFTIPPQLPQAESETTTGSQASANSELLASLPDMQSERGRAGTRRSSPYRIRVDSVEFFYASPDAEIAAVSVAALSQTPPIAITLDAEPRPLTKGEELIVIYAPVAARNPAYAMGQVKLMPAGPSGKAQSVPATVRAVGDDGSRFWYDIDPCLHAEHTLLDSKGCAIFRRCAYQNDRLDDENKASGHDRFDLVGLRVANAKAHASDPSLPKHAVGAWSHEAVSVIGLLRQLTTYAKEEAIAHAHRLEQAADKEQRTIGGLSLQRRIIKQELTTYLARRTPVADDEVAKPSCCPVNVNVMNGGAAFVASCASHHGIWALLPLSMDFLSSGELEGAAETMNQIAVLASTPGEAGFNAAMEAALRIGFLNAANFAIRGVAAENVKLSQEDIDNSDLLSSAELRIRKLREGLAAAAGDAIAAIARRVNADGFCALRDAKVTESIVIAFRSLAHVVELEGSLITVTPWLLGTLRAAVALCKASKLAAQLADAGIVPAFERLHPEIKSLTRRGREIAVQVAKCLAMWTKIKSACDACSERESGLRQLARESELAKWSRPSPTDGELVGRLRQDGVALHSRDVASKHAATLKVCHFHQADEIIARRIRHWRLERDGERPHFHSLPRDKIEQVIQMELDAANARIAADFASTVIFESQVEKTNAEQHQRKYKDIMDHHAWPLMTQVAKSKFRAQLPCPDVQSKSLRTKIFSRPCSGTLSSWIDGAK